MMPLQSSSLPLQVSGIVGNTGHMYSHPSIGLLSTSAKPALHIVTVHLPPTHATVVLGKLHAFPQDPQLLISVIKSKPSLTFPVQKLSWLLQTFWLVAV